MVGQGGSAGQCDNLSSRIDGELQSFTILNMWVTREILVCNCRPDSLVRKETEKEE